MKKNINLQTENSLKQQFHKTIKNKGILECIKYENINFLSKINTDNKKILELGCGIFPSSFGAFQNKKSIKFTASDCSNQIIELAKKIEKKNFYKRIDLEKKIKLDACFDVIILKGVIHHIKHPEKLFKQLKNYLSTNGILLICEPNLSSLIGNLLKWMLKKIFKRNLEDSPYGQYSFKKIEKSLKKSKFKIKRIWYSSLILLIVSGDYGRINFMPNNKYLYYFFIFLEKILYLFTSFLGVSKYLYFKLNLIVTR